jgi:hypothetical protein
MAELPFIIEKRGTVWVIDWSAKGGSGCAPASAAEVQLWQALQGAAAQLAAEVALTQVRANVLSLRAAAIRTEGDQHG